MSALFWIAITEEQAEQVLCWCSRCWPCMNCTTFFGVPVIAGQIDFMAVDNGAEKTWVGVIALSTSISLELNRFPLANLYPTYKTSLLVFR